MPFERKSKSGRVTIGITFYTDKPFHGKIKAAAKRDGRSVCSWVIETLKVKMGRPM